MKYHLVAGVITSAFTVLAAADSNVPSGCTHKEEWGNAVVENDCSVPVYFVLDNNAATATISPSSQTSIPIYEKDADKGGMSIKLFKNKDTDIWSVPALTQFEITATTQQFFDISNVNSDIGTGQNGNGEDCDGEPPFMWDGMRMSTPDGKDVTCAAGENPCKSAYSLYNDDFATAATDLGNDITLTLCPGGGSGKGNKGGSAEGGEGKKDEKKKEEGEKKEEPTPTPTTAPKVEAKVKAVADSDGEVITVTNIVTADTVVRTVVVGEGEHQKAKRQHDHMHQHIHNKIHKRRHLI